MICTRAVVEFYPNAVDGKLNVTPTPCKPGKDFAAHYAAWRNEKHRRGPARWWGLSLFEFTSCQRLMANSISRTEHFKSNQRRCWRLEGSAPQMDLWPGFGCRVSCASTFVFRSFRRWTRQKEAMDAMDTNRRWPSEKWSSTTTSTSTRKEQKELKERSRRWRLCLWLHWLSACLLLKHSSLHTWTYPQQINANFAMANTHTYADTGTWT